MTTSHRPRLEVEYVLPLRWSDVQSRRESPELSRYLRRLAGTCVVTVVDGSDPEVFLRHALAWGRFVRHLRPEGTTLNGKVAGGVTGVRRARCERVVVADDDVRYTPESLSAVVAGLDRADLVRPQNVFTSLPWHARWDSGRTLVNRCLGVDYPGTHAVRRSTFVAMGGYAGDVMFENLELARTVEAHGGEVLDLPDVFVPRLPPSSAHFWSQRVRQAYDSCAQPGRLAFELAVLPVIALTAARSPRTLPVLAAATVVVAETGRRRAGGTAAFSATAALWAVPWVLERGVCAWLAVLAHARGGVRYGPHHIRRAATPAGGPAKSRALGVSLPADVRVTGVAPAELPLRRAGRGSGGAARAPMQLPAGRQPRPGPGSVPA